MTEVSTDDYGLTKLVYIRPAANFTLLDHVVVARRSANNVDGSDGTGTEKSDADAEFEGTEDVEEDVS